MLRLAHRILTGVHAHECVLNPEGDKADIAGCRELCEHERKCIRSVTTFVVDNVAEYYEADKKAEWEYAVDFPNCTPPFGCFFMEWIRPIVGGNGAWMQNGVLCWDTPVEMARKSLAGVWVDPTLIDAIDRTKPARVLIMSPWYATSLAVSSNAIYVQMRMTYLLDASGRILENHTSFFGGDRYRQLALDLAAGLHIALLGICFMHCKNVARVDATNSVGPTSKWLRRQKVPQIKYRVLDINPMREVLRTAGGGDESGLKKALHICRGHFAHYSDDKPLFGKYTGQFWKPAHVRGDLKQGAVVKDYSIKTN